jgi:hypothetical protein
MRFEPIMASMARSVNAIVGLPVCRLSVWSDGPEPVLEPQEPEEMKHLLQQLYRSGGDHRQDDIDAIHDIEHDLRRLPHAVGKVGVGQQPRRE